VFVEPTETDKAALAAAAIDGGSPASFGHLADPDEVPLLLAVLEARVDRLEALIGLAGARDV
jgi:hypothetical protein